MNVQEMNEWLQLALIEHLEGTTLRMRKPLPRMICKDNKLKLSVQSGEHLYSRPRKDGAKTWTHVEVGFPTVSPPESWSKYFDGDWEDEDHREGVYAYVPIEMVVEFINDHGGWTKEREL
jgi:hypothetical protein